MILLLLFTFLSVYIVKSWIDLLLESRKFNAPGPFPLPIVGNGYMFLGKPSRFLKVLNNVTKTYGDVYRIYLMTSPYIVLNHPKHIEAIVSSQELITKGKSYDFIKPWLGQGLLTATGRRWRTHRKFLTPAFHFNILQNFLPVFCRNQRVLNEKLRSLADGRPINLFPIIALTALDNVTESVMGVSFGAQKESESKYVKSINNLTEAIAQRMRNPFIEKDAIFKYTSNKAIQDQAIKVLLEHSQKVIAMRRKELEKNNITSLQEETETGIRNKHAFLDLLLLAEIDGKKVDDQSVREEVETIMFEGHDTTTSGISFCLFCISKHKHVQQKIYDEQKSVFGDDFDRDPSFADLNKLKYLELVIKESLRLFPSVPLIQRLVTQDTDVDGVHLLKGSSVVVNILQMQRHPDVYEDPMEFKPERFESTNKIKPFDWIPFSAGPRNCIGQKFAMVELKVVIGTIIKYFEVLPYDHEPELCADLILRSANGVYIKLLPRT